MISTIRSKTYFSDEWLSTLETDLNCEETDESIQSSDLEVIIKKIVDYYKEILGKEVDESLVPKVKQMLTDGDVDQFEHISDLLLGCAVTEEEKEVIMNAIFPSNDTTIEDTINQKNCTQTQRIDGSDGDIIDSNNLSEEEIKDSENVVNEEDLEKTESNSDNHSNSMISFPDIKAKESAQLSNNDLEIEFNNKNQLLEENQKLIIENEKYKKLIERMNKNEISIADHNLNAGTPEEWIAIKSMNQSLQNEIIKLKETEDTYLVELSMIREQLNHLKASHCEPLIWNREAITGFCDREYLYKLIIRYFYLFLQSLICD